MIVRPVLLASYRELLHAPIRMLLVVLLMLAQFVSAAAHHQPPSSGAGLWFGLILGAGLIGRPLSNGTLALLFTRPLRRADYVLTRWLVAVSAAGFCALLLQLVLVAEAPRTGRADWAAVAAAIGEDVLDAAGVVSVLVFLSSLVGGIGDAAVWVVLLIAGGLLRSMGSLGSEPRLTWLGTRLSDLVHPSLDLTATFGSSPPSWYAIAAYLSTVALCLAGAVEIVRRKEISYVSGGD